MEQGLFRANKRAVGTQVVEPFQRTDGLFLTNRLSRKKVDKTVRSKCEKKANLVIAMPIPILSDVNIVLYPYALYHQPAQIRHHVLQGSFFHLSQV